MKIVNEMKMTLLSCSSNESFARVAVTAFISQLDPTIEEIADIKTAVSEAVTNCIVHAYPDSLGTIWIRARIYEDYALEIVIRDRGIGIDNIPAARQPLFTTGGADRSGMGFTIMESFTDSLKVMSKTGRGTTVKLYRRILPRVRERSTR